jgi:hypothetical protein
MGAFFCPPDFFINKILLKELLKFYGYPIDEAKAIAEQVKPRHLGDRLKRIFFKNALYEVIVLRER